jgi:hypothetical protein
MARTSCSRCSQKNKGDRAILFGENFALLRPFDRYAVMLCGALLVCAFKDLLDRALFETLG